MFFLRKLILCLVGVFFLNASFAHDPHPPIQKNISFIQNLNQWDPKVLFQLSIQNSTLFFEKNCITHLVLDPKGLDKMAKAKFDPKIEVGPIKAHAYQVQFLNSSSTVEVLGAEKHDFYHNYYLGNDPSKWAANVPVYKSLTYKNLYSGIDLVYYDQSNLLKYEYIVAPGSSPSQIQTQYNGDVKLEIKNGVLLIKTSVGEVSELRPIAYQITAKGEKKSVTCNYKVKKNVMTFELGAYDPSLPLVIDPTLVFSTFSGSTGDNWGFTATYDLDGNMYGGGIARDPGYPITLGAIQTTHSGGTCDISISKFNNIGTTLIYSTYLGGVNSDFPHSLVVNNNNELYIFGTTGSPNFPVTNNAYDPTFNGGTTCTVNTNTFPLGSDIIVVKFNQSGTQLLGSTFLGGSGNDGLNLNPILKHNYADEARGEIMLDEHSNVYITSSTTSVHFPTTSNAYQDSLRGAQGAIVCKLNHNLSNLIWSTYLTGLGSSAVAGFSLSLGENNSVYITGGTTSPNLTTITTGVQPTYGGGTADGYIAHFSNDGTSLLGFTYFGSNVYDQSYLIKTDKFHHPHIVGQTNAPANTFVENAIWHYGAGQFITKFTPELDSIIWSTEFGNLTTGADISPTALLVDVCNRVYLSGWGGSRTNGFGGTLGLPLTADAFQTTTDNNDYYLMCIADDASSLLYGSFFGESNTMHGEHVDGGTSRFDRQGRIYQAVCAGCGGSSGFPTTPGAYSNFNNSSCNLAVFKIDFNLPAVVSEFNMPNTICAPTTINFVNQSLIIGSNTSFFWDFGDGTTSNAYAPTHTYTQAGLYYITLIVHDLGSCNFADTLTKPILVLANSTQTLPDVISCNGEMVQIGIPPAAQDQVTYQWVPTTGLSNPTISNPYVTPTTTVTYHLLLDNGVCQDTLIQTVIPNPITLTLPPQIVICPGETATIVPQITSDLDLQYYWSDSPYFTNILNTNFEDSTLVYTPTQQTTLLYIKVVSEHCEKYGFTQLIQSQTLFTVPAPVISCFNTEVMIDLQVTSPNCTYVWAPTEYIISGGDTDSPVVNPPSTTPFSVTITNGDGCITTLSVLVTKQSGTFLTELDAWCFNHRIFLGETTLLESTNFTDNIYTYSWTPSNFLSTPTNHSTFASPIITTLYTVRVTDIFGCFKDDTVTVYVTERICDEPYVFVPNAFTPNGDGINDVFNVRSVILDVFTLKIYNRLGELLFETSNHSKGWDGTFKGENCPAGVYDYFLEGVCNNQKQILKKGNVTLIR